MISLDGVLHKFFSVFYSIEEVGRQLLIYLGVSLAAYFGWNALELTFEPKSILELEKAAYGFLELSFFMSIGTALFFIKRWWQEKKLADKYERDDPFAKIDEMTNLLNSRDEAIKRSEARLRSIFRTAPAILGVVNEKRELIEINNKAVKLLGYTVEELLGNSVRMLYTSDEEFERIGKYKREQIAKKEISVIETTWKTKEGLVLNILLSSALIKMDDDSNNIAFAAMDITESKFTAKNLKLDEERLESLLRLSQIKDMSDKDLIDYSIEECVALTESKIGYFHFFDAKEVDLNLFHWSKSALEECTANKTAHYPLKDAGIWADCVRFKRPVVHNDYKDEPNKRGLPQGHFPVIRHMSVPVFDGDEVVAVAGVGNKETGYTDADVRQISLYMNNVWKIIKHNRFLLELEKSEEKFRSVIESSTDALMLVDSNGCIKYANPEAAKLLGESNEDCVGLDFGFPMSDGSVGDIDIVDSNGIKYDVEMRVKVIMLFNEKVFLVSLRDITERKRVEELLRYKEAIHSAIFSNMSDGVAVYEAVDDGANFRCLEFNSMASEMDLFDPTDVEGRLVTEAFPGVRAMGLLEVFERVWRTGEPEYVPSRFYQDERTKGWRENYICKLPTGEIVAIYTDATYDPALTETLKTAGLDVAEIYKMVRKPRLQGIEE